MYPYARSSYIRQRSAFEAVSLSPTHIPHARQLHLSIVLLAAFLAIRAAVPRSFRNLASAGWMTACSDAQYAYQTHLKQHGCTKLERPSWNDNASRYPSGILKPSCPPPN